MTTTFEHPRIGGRIVGLRTRAPEVWKIKIGRRGAMRKSRQGTDFQPPERLDHILITKLKRVGEQHNFEVDQEIHAIIGDRPTSLPVRLVYDNPDLNLFSNNSMNRGKKRFCHGDGVRALRMQEDGREIEIPCPCHFLETRECRPYGRFQCLLDIPGVPGLGGVAIWRTTSKQSVENLYSTMDWIARLTGGRLSNIPLRMSLIQKTSEIPDPRNQGGTMTSTYPLMALQFPDSIGKLYEYATKAIEAERGYADRLRAIEARTTFAAVDDADDEFEDDLAEAAAVEAGTLGQELPEVEPEAEPPPEKPTNGAAKSIVVLGKPYERLGAARTALAKAIDTSDDPASLEPEVAVLTKALRKSGRAEIADELEQQLTDRLGDGPVANDDAPCVPDEPPSPDAVPDDASSGDEMPELDF